MDFFRVKVDIVSCDKFSAEVGDNLDANYKPAQSFCAICILNYQIPSHFHQALAEKKRETDKNTDVGNGSCSAVKQAFRH